MRIPKYRRFIPRNRGFVEWKGKRYYLPGDYGSPQSQKAYQEFLRKNVLTGDPGEIAVSAPGDNKDALPLANLVAAYLAHARNHYGEGRTEYGNCFNAIKPFLKRFKHLRAAEVGPKLLAEYQEGLANTLATNAATNLREGYIRSKINRIVRMYGWGVSQELVLAETHLALKQVKPIQARRSNASPSDPVTLVEWKHVLPVIVAAKPTIRAMLTLQWLTGVRSDSLCNATPGQFTREDDRLMLWRPKHKNEYRGVQLIVPIGPRAMKVIGPFISTKRPDEAIFSPRDTAAQRGQRRVNKRYRERYDTGSYYQAVTRLQKSIGVPRWSPHQVRHAKGAAINDDYGAEAAQAVLGHESLDTTKIYTERRLGVAIAMARQFG